MLARYDGLLAAPVDSLVEDGTMAEPSFFCEHANEVPQSCPCVPTCYCRQEGHTCSRFRIADPVSQMTAFAEAAAVERVAICLFGLYPPFAYHNGVFVPVSERPVCPWNRLADYNQDEFRKKARTVITAMRGVSMRSPKGRFAKKTTR